MCSLVRALSVVGIVAIAACGQATDSVRPPEDVRSVTSAGDADVADANGPGAVVPDVALVNQVGVPMRTGDFRGRVLLVTFIYTRCPLPDFCPRLMRNFSEFQRALVSSGDMAARVQLLSVTIDPEFDKPEVLRAYGERFLTSTRSQSRWDLVTGRPEDVRRLAAFVGLTYEPDSGVIQHSMEIAIFGTDGRLVRRFPETSWDQAEAMRIVAREATRVASIQGSN